MRQLGSGAFQENDMSAFSEFSLLLTISAIAGAISVRLRQPVIIAYIVVGIIASPAVFGLVAAHEQIGQVARSWPRAGQCSRPK